LKTLLNNNHTRFARVLVVILILIPLMIISYPLIFEESQRVRQEEITKNNQMADLTAHYLNDYIYGHKATLKNLAATDAVLAEDRDAIQQIMKDFDLAHPEPSLYWVADSSGTLIAKYPDSYMDKSIQDRDFFKETMKGQTFTGGPYIGRVTGLEVIVVSVPYYRNHEIAGVVGISIPLDELQKKLAMIQVGHTGYASLINMGGEVLSHPDLKEFRKTYSFENSPIYDALIHRQADRGFFDQSPQERKMHSFVKIIEAPWVVVIVQPLDDFNLKLSESLGRNSFILFVVILFLALLIHYMLLLRDRKNAEKIKQTEKLAVVGELAAGVAHEIRNPLTAIKGFVQLIDLKKGPDVPPLYIETILDELDRIEQIVGEMVVLAKPTLEEKSQVNLATLLEDTVNLMFPQASMKNVEIHLTVEPGMPLIEGVRNQLKQVMINLIKNAIEALEKGGTITIRADYQSEKVLISVADDGEGFGTEILKKLGTPFFTTKKNGTGLGLMTSYRIIQNHAGEISVKSQLDIGTEFRITLPVKTTSVDNE
jgi:signal transduction histidine kinase